MEEKKLKKVESKKSSDKEQKLTYEQLNEACANLSQQNQYLTQRLQMLGQQFNQVNNAFKRLDCLFSVLRYAEVINDAEFISACVDEIKSIMILPKEEKTDTEAS